MNSREQAAPSGLSAEPAMPRPLWARFRGSGDLGTRGMVAWLLLTTLAFVQPLARFVVHVVESNLHSYVLVVPVVVAYLLRIRQSSLEKTHRSSPVLGVTVAGLALAILVAAVSVRSRVSPHDFLALTTLAYVTLTVAGGFLFLGSKWMASAAFPIAFLFFLVPLPDGAVDALEKASVAASSEAANAFFKISGIPFLRDGTVFTLPTITLRVAQECSGIRSSWVLVISSLLAANMFLKGFWRRALLVAFVVPLGIIRNGFRILTLGMLCVHIGPEMIDSPIHHYGGPLFFALSLVPLFVLIRWLSRQEET